MYLLISMGLRAPLDSHTISAKLFYPARDMILQRKHYALHCLS